eukprot:COSAG03_NODE_16136_length_411_cov_0.496795_1_plen_88_part_10
MTGYCPYIAVAMLLLDTDSPTHPNLASTVKMLRSVVGNRLRMMLRDDETLDGMMVMDWLEQIHGHEADHWPPFIEDHIINGQPGPNEE